VTIDIMGKREGAAVVATTLALTALASCQLFIDFDYADAGRDGGTASDASDEGIDHGPVGRVFVTSFEVPGDFGGVAGGDSICASAAADAGLIEAGRPWRAYLADDWHDAVMHLGPGQFTWYKRLDGEDVGDIIEYDVQPLNAIAISERGDAHVPRYAWTGINQHDCANWTTRDGGADSQCGIPNTIHQWNAVVELQPCTITAGLYCVEQQQ
jgi:hypothetical protein